MRGQRRCILGQSIDEKPAIRRDVILESDERTGNDPGLRHQT